MKILVIGAVAAGTKAAAKIKRELGNGADVLVITKEQDISYAGCGLPYYIGGVVKERSELLQNTPESFAGLTGVTVRCGVEAKGLDAANKTVQAVDLASGEELSLGYDKLVIATGARPWMPQHPGHRPARRLRAEEPLGRRRRPRGRERRNEARGHRGRRSHRRGDGGKPLQPRRAREHHRHGAAHPAGL